MCMFPPRLLGFVLLVTALLVTPLLPASDLALAPPQILTGPPAQYATATRKFQGIPGIERAPKGRLWATWYAGGPGEGPENYVVLVTSADQGKSWSEPVLVVDAPGYVRAFDPCLWVDPDGGMWLTWAQGAGKFDGRSGVWAIRTKNPDSAKPKWSKPRRLADGVMMNKPTVLRNGEWLFPAAMWWTVKPDTERINREYNLGLSEQQMASMKHDLDQRNGAHLLRTADHGKTFQLIPGPRVPSAAFDEHMMIEKKNGDWDVFVRTKYGIGVSTSTDGGKTWSEGKDTGIRHTDARFFIRRLKSGNLLLVRHNWPESAGPKDTRRINLTAQISKDDGNTWTGGLLLDGRRNVSYPDGFQAPDGSITIVYDRERQKDMDILFSRFEEADVEAGKCVTPACSLQNRINTAGQP